MRGLLASLCWLGLVACSPVKVDEIDGGGDDVDAGAFDAAAPLADGMMCLHESDCTGLASHCLDGECVECVAATDCGPGLLCDSQTHACHGCEQSADCPSNVCDPVLATCAS